MSNSLPTVLANAVLSVEAGELCIRSESADLLYKFTPYPGFKRTTQPLAEALRVAHRNAEDLQRRDGVSLVPEPREQLKILAARMKDNHEELMVGFHRNDGGNQMQEALVRNQQLTDELASLVTEFSNTTTV